MSQLPRTAARLTIAGALFTMLAPLTHAQQPSAAGDSLEITDQRLDQLLDGLKGEQPLRQRIAKETGAVGQHPGPPTEKEIATMQACGKADMERRQAQIRADPNYDPKKMEEMDKENRKQMAKAAKEHQKRMQELIMSGDGEALQRYQDSLRRPLTQSSAHRTGPDCGSLEANASPAQLAQIDTAGAKASGLTLPQYVILRGRVANYFRTGGADGGGLTKAEKKVFEKRGRDLMPYGMMLGSSSP